MPRTTRDAFHLAVLRTFADPTALDTRLRELDRLREPQNLPVCGAV